MRLSNAVERFLEQLRANACSMHTVRSYRMDLNRLLAFHGRNGASVQALTSDSLARFMNSPDARLAPDGRERCAGTMHRQRTVLRSFCRWLQESGHLARNPACTLRSRHYPEPPPRLVDREDYARLLNAMADLNDPLTQRDRLIVGVLAGVGIRVSEVVGLNVSDVDLDSGRMVVHAKGGHDDVRYVNRALCAQLRRHVVGRDAHRPLFAGSAGRRLTTRHVARRLELWLKRAGIDRRITPHAFRHTLASRLLAQTGNLRLVQRALGHRSIVSTVRYAQLPDEALISALEAARSQSAE
jgi:integrase/recombinase XerC